MRGWLSRIHILHFLLQESRLRDHEGFEEPLPATVMVKRAWSSPAALAGSSTAILSFSLRRIGGYSDSVARDEFHRPRESTSMNCSMACSSETPRCWLPC